MPKYLGETDTTISVLGDDGNTRTVAKVGIDPSLLESIRKLTPEENISVPNPDFSKYGQVQEVTTPEENPVDTFINNPLNPIGGLAKVGKVADTLTGGIIPKAANVVNNVTGAIANQIAEKSANAIDSLVNVVNSPVYGKPNLVSKEIITEQPSVSLDKLRNLQPMPDKQALDFEKNNTQISKEQFSNLPNTGIIKSSENISETSPNMYGYELPGTKDILEGTEKLNAVKRMQAMAEESAYNAYKDEMAEAEKNQLDLKKTWDEAYQKSFNDMEDTLKQLNTAKVKDYWEDKNIFSRIFAALLVGGGEYARIKTGGQTNIAKDIIDNAIEQNYKRQKANLELKQGEVNNKRNLLNDIRTKFNDETDQYKAYKAALGDALRIKLLDVSAQNQGNVIGAQAQIEAGRIQNENTKLLEEIRNTQAQTALVNKKAEQDASRDKNLTTWFTNYDDTKKAIAKMREFLNKYGTLNRIANPEVRKLGTTLAETLRSAVQKVEGWGTRYNKDMQTRFDKLLGSPSEVLNPIDHLDTYEAALDAKADVRKMYGTAEGQPSLLGEAQDYSEDVQ